jgi:hypothetical protein
MTRCIRGGRWSRVEVRALSTGLGFDHVVVVEDEDEIVWEARDFIEQGG